jgi:hypothetical protein
MPDNIQNTSQVDTNASNKPALVTDLNDTFVSNEQYSHGRNLIKSTKDGDLGTLGNEPSNHLCYAAPYKIIGIVPMGDDLDMVFSTNNINSEIGIANRKICSYEKKLNMTCLNFNTNYPITGVAKKHYEKGYIITFTDKYNPVRRVEVSKLGTIKNCDEILLWRKIDHPCIGVERGTVGNVPNGAYSVCIAYTIDGEIFSDFYSITNRVLLYSENNANSLEITLSRLDKDFDKFALVVVGNYIDPVTKGVTKTAKIVGEYSTKTTKIAVTDFINSNHKEIGLDRLVIKKKSWQKAGIITSNSNYLILADLISRPEENYQLKAMQIESEYVVEQVDADYYGYDGRDVGYYRDENYDFYIQGIFNTGEETEKYHIAGPKPKANDLVLASGADVYELDTQFKDCSEPDKILNWQVNNTAGQMKALSEEFKCNRRMFGYGDMGYHASTEVYADNKAKYGDDAGTPIRFHRMPDETKVPRYSVVDGKYYINILGIRFKNIPKFDNPDIVGYKITRSDRKGGNGTVVARGIMTNVRSYFDKQANQNIMFSNYPVNDLNPDVFLSETQTVFKGGRETNFKPIEGYFNDRFNFYSPHTSFEPRYTLGNEIKIESEEIAEVDGQFQIVHNHPKLKLLNQFAWWLALAVGIVETYFEAQGLKHQQKADISGQSSGTATITGTSAGTINFNPDGPGPLGVKNTGTSTGRNGGSVLSITGQATKDAINDLIKLIASGNFSQIKTYIKVLRDVLRVIVNAGITAGLTVVTVMKYAQETLDIIDRFTGETDYVYQYNSHAKFTKSIPVNSGNKRRRLLKPAHYIPSTTVTIEGEVFNNLLSEKSVYLHLNKEIKEPTTKDTTRNTISGFGLCDDPTRKAKSTGSAFYATSKVINPNQYGQVGSSLPVSMHSCVLSFSDGEATTTPVLYGGDCVISKFYIQKRRQFFNQTLANTNYPPGTEYDYRLYRNIAYPRYWLDSSQYDYGELLKKKQINFATFNRTTANRHNLDCKKSKDGDVPTRIDDAYMYTSNNCAMEFFVECDYNPAFREKTEQPFYSQQNTNLSDVFRSDRLETPEEFKISRAFSDLYTTEIFPISQREDFDPANPLAVEQPNSVIYSLPSFNLQRVDNWQYFLPGNWFAFNESDFGKLSAIHKMDQDRLIFLFTAASPFISMGQSLLQLSGQTVTIGDGGLFAQDPREVMPTSNNFGASTSRYAFSATHGGRFYISENQGRIFNFTGGLEPISNQGMSFWCKNYMPMFLYKYFPNYDLPENPISGVGYLIVFDSHYETLYITKRDFSPKREYERDIVFDKVKGFLFQGTPIQLRDPKYFNDVSWTLSYSLADSAFVSWHDWHPDWIIQTDNHFMTVKDNTVWKHNERYDSFCNFYGRDFPFEWEPISSSGQNVETLRSLEYFLEVYKYRNMGRDKFHVKDENFSHLIVNNSEQMSPLYNLTIAPVNPKDRLGFPRKNTTNNVSFDILFEKVEQKYRINQFWDAVKDRESESHFFPVDESGYKRVVNPVAIDLDKPETERKKFRHYFNRFFFIKDKSGDKKFIMKLVNIKKLISPR